MTQLVETKQAAHAVAPVNAGIAATEPLQYLTFMLGGEIFAVGILGVKEIIEYQKITDVPMMPECVRGVINLRGAVVPVMDLQARFGRAQSEVGKRTCIVIVEIRAASDSDERQIIGVVVDAVNEVLDIAAADIEPPPAFGAKIRTDFIQGMAKVEGKFVILLDADNVLSIDEATLAAIEGKAPAELN